MNRGAEELHKFHNFTSGSWLKMATIFGIICFVLTIFNLIYDDNEMARCTVQI